MTRDLIERRVFGLRTGVQASLDFGSDASRRKSLLRKYTHVIGLLVFTTLLLNCVIGSWFYYYEHKSELVRFQQQQVRASADKIELFLRGLEGQIGWAVQLPWLGTSLEQRRLDALRLLGQAPAVAELSLLDTDGREQLKVSRLALNVLRSGLDLSNDPRFTQARASGSYYGPVYFRRESEPFLTLAIAGRRRVDGVAIAEINLKYIWDLVTRIAVGIQGTAYLVDGTGRLIAHPDISLVLRKRDLTGLPQVQDALRHSPLASSQTYPGMDGRPVVVASAAVAPTDWTLLIEVPVSDVFAPIYRSLGITAWLLLGTLALSAIVAWYLARRLVVPIRLLKEGAAQIADGDLAHRITVGTGDELEELANGFNEMAQRLERSYSELEAKVIERTSALEKKSRELEIASEHKTQFLAIMSHELRTPLNAIIGLTEAMTRHSDRFGTSRALEPLHRVHRAGLHLLELINQLLDLAKIEAGKLELCREPTRLSSLMSEIVETTRPLAVRHGNILKFDVDRDLGSADVDPLRLRQILLNVVGNACKFTKDGTIVFSARRACNRDGREELEFVVTDTGIGMTPDQLAIVFDDFAQATPTTVRQFGGTGLGLSIARRLCELMDGDITASSELGRGSRFRIGILIGGATS